MARKRGKLQAGVVWMEFNLLKECIFAKWPLTAPIMALIKTFTQAHLYYQFICGITYFLQVLLFNQNILLNLNPYMGFSSPPDFWFPEHRELTFDSF